MRETVTSSQDQRSLGTVNYHNSHKLKSVRFLTYYHKVTPKLYVKGLLVTTTCRKVHEFSPTENNKISIIKLT